MNWIRHLFGQRDAHPPQADRAAFRRREAELKERYERLERLAVEAEVIQRADQPEGQPRDATR